jgi:hypothetical protein
MTDSQKNKTVKVHPDKTPRVVKVRRGGTLTFVNECNEYPDFEVAVKKSESPEIAGEAKGTTRKPIKLRVLNKETSVDYSLVFKDKNGKQQRRDGQFKMAKEPPPHP